MGLLDDLDGYSSGPCHRLYVMLCYLAQRESPR